MKATRPLGPSAETAPKLTPDGSAVAVIGPPAHERFRFIDDEAIERLPPPVWLIDEVFPVPAIGIVYAPPESFKTFFTLALAFSVASKEPFFGRAVRHPGPVVYVAGEGSAGLPVRVGAWKHSRERYGRAGVHFLDEPVRLLEGDQVGSFVHAVERFTERPRLIIFDTLALCMPGSDEGTADMSTAVEALRYIRRLTHATVVAVHHTRLDAERERGSTNLRGGVDTMIALKRDGSSVTVSCEKQKEAAKFAPFTLELVDVEDSCTLVTAQNHDEVTTLFPSDPRYKTLRLLHDSSTDDGLSTTAWLKCSEMKDSTFYKARKQLIALGYVDCSGRRQPNRITPAGEAAL